MLVINGRLGQFFSEYRNPKSSTSTPKDNNFDNNSSLPISAHDQQLRDLAAKLNAAQKAANSQNRDLSGEEFDNIVGSALLQDREFLAEMALNKNGYFTDSNSGYAESHLSMMMIKEREAVFGKSHTSQEPEMSLFALQWLDKAGPLERQLPDYAPSVDYYIDMALSYAPTNQQMKDIYYFFMKLMSGLEEKTGNSGAWNHSDITLKQLLDNQILLKTTQG